MLSLGSNVLLKSQGAEITFPRIQSLEVLITVSNSGSLILSLGTLSWIQGKDWGHLTDNPNHILNTQHFQCKLYEKASTPTEKQAALISLLFSPSIHVIFRVGSKLWF